MSRPAARVEDQHFCPLGIPKDHVGGPILPRQKPRTFINGKPAARVGDKADCEVAPDDTVRGGLMTVFIDGHPASRIHDNTDIGLIMEGSPTVLLGESTPGPLTPFQAEWLYKYLDSQRDTIPFEYADYGCEVRADRMCELISSLGIPVRKQWVRCTPASGKLYVPIENYPQGGVTWDWHVAPVVEVTRDNGVQSMVIDPSLGFKEPVTVETWIQKQTTKPKATVTESSSKEIYRRGWNMAGTSWDDSRNELRNSKETRDHLNFFRNKRAALPQGSDRKAPNRPAHF